MAYFPGSSPLAAGCAVGLQILLTPSHSAGLVRCACAVVGVGVPVYSSFKAVESGEEIEREEWLLYWTVYGSLTLLEQAMDRLVFWFPYYHHAKLLLLIWLQIPNNTGARSLYKKFVRPALSRHQDTVDNLLDVSRRELARMMRVNRAELEWIGRMLQKGVATGAKGLQDILRSIVSSSKDLDGPQSPSEPPSAPPPGRPSSSSSRRR